MKAPHQQGNEGGEVQSYWAVKQKDWI